jgi:hypothetical protein
MHVWTRLIMEYYTLSKVPEHLQMGYQMLWCETYLYFKFELTDWLTALDLVVVTTDQYIKD